MALSPLVNVMIKAARKAARSLRRDYGEIQNLQVSRKGPADFVTNADLKAEEIIAEELRHARPEYGFLMEESGAKESSDPKGRRWIVDPLDGTTNFMHGLPHFAISIAAEEAGEIVAGVIFDPIKDELFRAEKGDGAFMNDVRLRVAARRRLDEAIFATGIPFKGIAAHEPFLRELPRVMAETAGVRRWGTASLDLAYVAAGRVDGFWERNLKPWDYAAGILLVREAGGVVSEIDKRVIKVEASSILAANEALHTQLAALLEQPANA
jgi:myo-inositol-1(or 4)-monophosphatase